MRQLVNNIKKLRELRDFTQKYMAEAMGMTQANYSKIENGDVDLPYSRLEQIAQILKTNIEDLISNDEKKVFKNYFEKVEVAQNMNTGDILATEDLKNAYQTQITFLENEILRLHTLLEKALNK